MKSERERKNAIQLNLLFARIALLLLVVSFALLFVLIYQSFYIQNAEFFSVTFDIDSIIFLKAGLLTCNAFIIIVFAEAYSYFTHQCEKLLARGY